LYSSFLYRFHLGIYSGERTIEIGPHLPTLAQESPADARVTRDSAVIPRWPSAAILDNIETEIAPFDPPTPKTLV